MTRMFLILFLIWSLCAMPGMTAGQQIYKWVDEKGTVHFSDTPTSADLKPQGKQNSKERTLEVVTGVEKTKEPSQEELLIEYSRKRDREQGAIRQAEQERQEKMLKTIKDQQEEIQSRRDRAADMLEKEARKTKTFYDHKGRVIGSGMTKGQQQMLRDAARLRSGVDLEASDETEKLKRRAEEEEKKNFPSPQYNSETKRKIEERDFSYRGDEVRWL